MGFSRKQKQILTFPTTKYTSLICDGAVRSGKTSVMAVSFILWIMHDFNQRNFAICGKSVQSAVRNVIRPLMGIVYFRQNGFDLNYSASNHLLTVTRGNKVNYIYVFGGKDESSYALIQGITLAGVFLDEVALMPRSFVEQAMARCSVDGSRYWFNCNPENPQHWFYQEWILKAKEKNALHIHFLMTDNPSLSQEILDRYEQQYTGVFYDRYIRGLWVNPDGMVYPDFNEKIHYITPDQIPSDQIVKWFVGVDFGWEHYGSFVLIGKTDDGVYYLVKEWAAQHRHIDQWVEIGLQIKENLGNINFYCDSARPEHVQQMRVAGLRALNARKEVMSGISEVASLYKQKRLFIVKENAPRFQEEIYGYVWKEGADDPVKENDDTQDAIRYGIYSDLKYGR